jgi:hypothetical protein
MRIGRRGSSLRTNGGLIQSGYGNSPRRARRERVFLCGSIGNEGEVWSFFEKVFLLSIDEATMRHRLLTRTAHDFGTKAHELELVLAWNEAIGEHYLRRGAITIDATRPPLLIVDDILRMLENAS